jgi:hypothetical protein
MDLALPVAPYYRTDPQVLKDIEMMRTTAASRWAKDDYSRTLSRFHTTDDSASKLAALAQPKVEILRANSPTLKRLIGARIKLERYANSALRINSTSRQSIREPVHSKLHEKQVSGPPEPVQIPSQPSPPAPPIKQIKPQSNASDRPLDKITYEKTWTLNGNVKQKCSLEIWLPKPSLDDDEDKNSSRGTISEIQTIDKVVQPIPAIRSRRSSIVKISATTIANIETKSIDDVASKKAEPIVIPRVYHYGDYVMDLPDERPRSSKSVTTVKSDSATSSKSIRRQHARPNNRRLSSSTHHSEEILRFGTIEVPTSAKTISVHTKSTGAKPTNTVVISELMQKYSLIKRNQQELTQQKMQLEKYTNDSKSITSTIKDQSPRSRPPPIPESTNLISPDHPTIAVKKLIVESSPIRSITEQTNNKLLERRATPRKPSHSDIYPHLRIFSLANQRQHRQSSATIPPALLPNVSGKKTDEPPRILQRSKTLDVVLNIPNPIKIKSRMPITPDNLLQPRTSKRPGFNIRSGQNYQRSSTTIPTNTLLIRFHHGTTERNYIVPD